MASLLAQKTKMIFNKAVGDNKALTEQDGKIGFDDANPVDLNQQWIKDDSWGASFQDAKGNPAFAIVNLNSGDAIKQPKAPNQPVEMVRYVPNLLVPDETLLWISIDAGNGFTSIHELKNPSLVLDAPAGGLPIFVVAANHSGADSQLWKMQKKW